MATTTVRSGLLHALDIIQHLSAKVIFDLHVRKHTRQVEDLLVGQLANAAGRVDVETSQEAGGGIGADPKKALEGLL